MPRICIVDISYHLYSHTDTLDVDFRIKHTHTRTSELLNHHTHAVHWNADLDHILLLSKFHDDISNGSRVIVSHHYTDMYNGILIGTYIRRTQRCHFE